MKADLFERKKCSGPGRIKFSSASLGTEMTFAVIPLVAVSLAIDFVKPYTAFGIADDTNASCENNPVEAVFVPFMSMIKRPFFETLEIILFNSECSPFSSSGWFIPRVSQIIASTLSPLADEDNNPPPEVTMPDNAD